MTSLTRAFPAVVFLVTGVMLIPAGILLPFAAAANNGPAAGQVAPGNVVFGLALVVVGVVLIWVAWGLWRAKRWRTHLGLGLAIFAFAGLVLVWFQNWHPIAWVYTDAGDRIPVYGTRPEILSLMVIVDAVVVACLVVVKVQDRRLATRSREA
jgi:hypothetical protein